MAAAVTGVLAVLALGLTIVAAWAEATVLRPEPVAELLGDALDEPEVQVALAQSVTDQLAAAVDLEEVLVAVLPGSLDRVAPTITTAVRSGVERRLTDALGDPDVRAALTTAVERAHRAAMQLLRGDGLVDGLTVADGQITVNVLPLVARGLLALQSFGLLDDVEVPALARDGDPAEQRAQLSAALGRDLPPELGQLVVYEGSAVDRATTSVQSARGLLAFAERGLWLLAVVAALLAATTLGVATRRRRAALVLAAGIAAAAVVLRTAVRQVVGLAVPLATRRPTPPPTAVAA